MKLNYFIFTFLFGIILLGCSEKNSISFDDRFPINSLDQINDSIFITDGIGEFLMNDSVTLIVDNKQSKVFITDSDFKIVKTLNYGDGPTDIRHSYKAVLRNNKIYIADYGKMALSKFSYGGVWLETIKAPFDEFHSFIYEFGVDDEEKFYLQSFQTINPIIKINNLSEVEKEFGHFPEYESEAHNRAINTQNLIVTDNNNIINVFTSHPIIELYSNDGDLLNRLDLSDFFSFRTKKYEELLIQNPNFKNTLSFAYYNDITLSKNKLYLLFIGDYEIPNSNQVAIINLDDNSMKLERVINLKLEGAFFKEITINNETLWAYDKEGAELIQFKL